MFLCLPSFKHVDCRLWHTLYRFEPTSTVWQVQIMFYDILTVKMCAVLFDSKLDVHISL